MFTVSHGAVGRMLLFNFIYLCSAYSGCYFEYVGDSMDLFPVYIGNLVFTYIFRFTGYLVRYIPLFRYALLC